MFLSFRKKHAVILHIGVNDLLEENNQSKIENLGKNLRSIVEKCYTYGIKNVFISGLVYTTRKGLPVLEKSHLNDCASL